MRKGIILAGMFLGAALILPFQAQAQSIKPTGSVELAYVPSRQEGWVHTNEVKAGASLGVEGNITDKLFYFIKGRGELYTDFSGINYAQAGIEGELKYNNLALFLSYAYGGSAANHDLTNMLTIGTRFALGSEPKRDTQSPELNAHGSLELGYTPFRQQYGAKNSNEIKTQISGTAELDYKDLYLNFLGSFAAFENADSLLQFTPNIQGYLTRFGLGYKGFEIYFYDQCYHALALANKGATNVNITSQEGDVTIPFFGKDQDGNPYLINQEQESALGIKWDF